MTPGFRARIRELTTVRVLSFLKSQGPATRADLDTLVQVPSGAPVQAVLPDLEQSGLVVRQQGPTPGQGKAKPYSITPEGERHLEEARQRLPASVHESGEGRGWAAQHHRAPDVELHRSVMDVLIGQREFRNSNETRIRRLASEIIDVVERTANRQR